MRLVRGEKRRDIHTMCVHACCGVLRAACCCVLWCCCAVYCLTQLSLPSPHSLSSFSPFLPPLPPLLPLPSSPSSLLRSFTASALSAQQEASMSGVLSYCHIHITYVHPLFMYLQPYIHHICTYLTRLKTPSKHPPYTPYNPLNNSLNRCVIRP